MFSVCEEFGLDENKKLSLEERILNGLTSSQSKTYTNVEQIYTITGLRKRDFIRTFPVETFYYDLMEIAVESIKGNSDEELLKYFYFNPEYYWDFNYVISKLNARIFGPKRLHHLDERGLKNLFGDNYPSVFLLRKFHNLENLEIKTFYDLIIEREK